MADIRQALKQLEYVGYSRDDLSQFVAVSDADGKLYLQLPGMSLRARPGRQGTLPDVLNLVAPYKKRARSPAAPAAAQDHPGQAPR